MQFYFVTPAVDILYGTLRARGLAYYGTEGSEFPCVVIPLHTQHYLMLQRNLIYTAVTRGNKLVVLVGTKKALGIGRIPGKGTRH